MTAVVWFTRDLRVHDHPALRAALAAHERVVPVFCFDDRLLHGRHASGPRTQFLLECLADLDGSLRARGSGLVLRHGPPERELTKLGADEVYATADVGPFARARQEEVRTAMRLRTFPGVAAVDDLDAVRTQAGRPYTVFSPFHRTWLGEPRRDVLGAPRKLPPLPARLRKGRLPSLRSLGLTQEVAEPPRGGEREARKLLRRGSRVSPYLHLGCISARELEAQREGDDDFRRSLCWRDFFQHVLLHFPDNAHAEFQERYRGALRWRRPGRDFDAWREGRTGYPFVDAGMRQLLREGWMHNRLRMVVGSFLTKDLGIDWRHGERHFMRLLVDGDEANNNGNWQWIASVGTDPQPVSRRIFNPTRQMEAHDPDGAYVRRYVPELAQVPDEHLREPWTMPVEVQRRAGCVIGRDYPAPVVDHAEARREALARYAAARDAGSC